MMAQSKITSFFTAKNVVKLQDISSVIAKVGASEITDTEPTLISTVKHFDEKSNDAPTPTDVKPNFVTEPDVTVVKLPSQLNIASMSKAISKKVRKTSKIDQSTSTVKTKSEPKKVSQIRPQQAITRQTRSSGRLHSTEAKPNLPNELDYSSNVPDQSADSPADAQACSENVHPNPFGVLRRSQRNRSASVKSIESEESLEEEKTIKRESSIKRKVSTLCENLKDTTKPKRARQTKKRKGEEIPLITIDDVPASNYISTPLPPPTYPQLWTHTYKPKSEADFIGHSREVETFKMWLKTWHATFNTTSDDTDDDEDEYSSGECIDGKCLFIHGSSGLGKTSLVAALANDFGYKVLEYNASNLKLTPSIIQNNMSESLQSHYINQVSVASFFGPKATQSKSVSGSQGSSVKLSKSLFLIDDLDGILYENRQCTEIWRSLKQVIVKARKPLILISSLDSNYLCNEARYFCTISLHRVKTSDITMHLKTILMRESANKDIEDVSVHERVTFAGDIRNAVTQAQFWQDGSIGSIGKQPKEDAHPIDSDPKESDLLGDSVKRHLALIDLLSSEDVVSTSLEHLWNRSLTSTQPYNRHLYDNRLTFTLSADESANVCLYQRQHREALATLEQSNSNDHSTLHRFVTQSYAPQCSGTHFADYAAFFRDLCAFKPDLIDQIQYKAQQSGCSTRSAKSSAFTFM